MSSSTAPIDPAVAAEDRSWVVIVVISSLLSITFLAVGLRMYTRAYLLKQVGRDDYCVLLTLVFVVLCAGFVLALIPNGLGRHTATLDPSLITLYLKKFYLSIIFYNISLCMVKLTFLFQYYRVLAVHKMKKVIIILGIIIMAWTLTQILTNIFACTPVQKFWQPELNGYCIPNLPYWYINATGNILSDLAIFIMPLPVLSKLQIRKKQKYFLIGIFCLGFFTCAISLIRLSYLKLGNDFTFTNLPPALWSVGEICCGVVCACLPTLRPLMTKIKPRWMTSYATRTKNRQPYGRSGKAQYGIGTQGNAGLKSSTGTRTQNTPDSSLTISSTPKNYSRLDDDEIEKAMPMPMHFGPVYRRSESTESVNMLGYTAGNFADEHDEIPMRPLQSKAKQSSRGKARVSINGKAMTVLGLGAQGVGVSTQVVGGQAGPSISAPDNGEYLGGIEVKRDVVVTTAPIDSSNEADRQLLREYPGHSDQRR